jgi:hypothetical protein
MRHLLIAVRAKHRPSRKKERGDNWLRTHQMIKEFYSFILKFLNIQVVKFR